MTDLPAAVISDANVLIDYISVDRTLVLRLVSEHLFSIKLPRSILNEVDQLTENQAEALGLKVIDATLAQLQEASKRGGSLSQPDKLCFAMAHDNHWAVWTSDKPSSDSSIYHLFVEQAKKLEPKFLSMVIPSRWLAGGRGLGEFRKEMLGGGQVRDLIDFPNSGDGFPGVQIKGGVCYFLWEREHRGHSNVTTIRGDEVTGPISRDLSEFDVFVRDSRAGDILRKVRTATHRGMDELVSNREPFKLESNFKGFHAKQKKGDIALYRIAPGQRRVDWVARTEIEKNEHLIDSWKIFVPKAYGAGESVPHQILGMSIIAPPPSVCTGSYLVISTDSEVAAHGIQSYYATKFFRFLVSLRKITQDAFSHMYSWVPQQSWDRTWTDEALYKQYDLTVEQIDYIEAVIKPMDVGND